MHTAWRQWGRYRRRYRQSSSPAAPWRLFAAGADEAAEGVRLRLSAEEITRLAELQLTILEQACVAVRPGGRLVYSTCSIDREEDLAVVEAFLSKHSEFSLAQDYLALPHREQADGAYATLLLRV
ncbi:MAG: hypothetical protein IKY91_00625 [Akkermansia sp.]|nr:hypothetical protein [Akkermansia sp.]